MPIVAPNYTKKRWTWFRDAKGTMRLVKLLTSGGNTSRSVTITTTSGQKTIVATAGTFDTTGLDVGAALSGNNTNTGAGNTIASVQDSTHATMTNNAAATDAVGTATTVTRTAALGGGKIRHPHSAPSGSRTQDNVVLATGMRQTGKLFHRRGPA